MLDGACRSAGGWSRSSTVVRRGCSRAPRTACARPSASTTTSTAGPSRAGGRRPTTSAASKPTSKPTCERRRRSSTSAGARSGSTGSRSVVRRRSSPGSRSCWLTRSAPARARTRRRRRSPSATEATDPRRGREARSRPMTSGPSARRWTGSRRGSAPGGGRRWARRTRVAALNERRVQTLLLEPGFDRPGARCPDCGLLLVEAGRALPGRRTELEQVDHLREAVVEAAPSGCRRARRAPLSGPRAARGIAALLRF